jgi:3-hydroxyisobutyrate dehydrogenase
MHLRGVCCHGLIWRRAGVESLHTGPRIADRNFDPGFFVEHFIKDMGIALAEARRSVGVYSSACPCACVHWCVRMCDNCNCDVVTCSMGISLPGLSLANQLYIAVQAQGHGRLGTHSLMLALETLNGIPHEPRK